MIAFLSNILTSFVLGLLTPTTAVCVLPLYPGFIAYLSNKIEDQEDKKKALLQIGILVVVGVITFMALVGVIFTTLLQASLTNVINIVSPVAFGILFIISIFLVLDTDFSKLFPKIKTPTSDNPKLEAFIYGFFFGAIVIPCNPLFIAALFTRTLSNAGFLVNFINFISFGFGIGFPLLLFAVISSGKSRQVIGFLVTHKRKINLFAGIFMMIVSLYYLFFVFQVQGLIF